LNIGGSKLFSSAIDVFQLVVSVACVVCGTGAPSDEFLQILLESPKNLKADPSELTTMTGTRSLPSPAGAAYKAKPRPLGAGPIGIPNPKVSGTLMGVEMRSLDKNDILQIPF
jgi:hypothetical protein